MKLKIKEIKIDPTEIAIKHHVAKGGSAELFLASEVERNCTPYVPWRQGILANTARVSPGKVEYITPYARRQYYEHRGSGNRGSHWDQRMLAQRRPSLVSAMAKYLGGKVG